MARNPVLSKISEETEGNKCLRAIVRISLAELRGKDDDYHLGYQHALQSILKLLKGKAN